MKRLLIVLLIIFQFIIPFKSIEASSLTDKTFFPTNNNVKYIGRTYYTNNSLWMAYSGSGIEFTFTGTKASITILGDNISNIENNDKNYCRIGIYVNGEIVIDTQIKQQSKVFNIYNNNKNHNVVITILKLSESINSTMGIGKIKVTSIDAIKPTENKQHKIEFIGDYILCGYGIDASVNDKFSTETENITKTYAYKVSDILDSDYSIVALSGYGVISGYTNNNIKNDTDILPIYYNKLGVSNGLFNNNIKVESLNWDFSLFQPDIIVINLGTNDSKYVRNYENRKFEFIVGYLNFLKEIRKNNPKSIIICTSGIMSDNMFSNICMAINIYILNSNDTNIFSMKFESQSYINGYGANGHPSEKTNEDATNKLVEKIKELTNW